MNQALIIAIFWEKMPDILNVKDVSNALEISPRSARGLMEKIGGLKIAGKWLLAKSKLKTYFEEDD